VIGDEMLVEEGAIRAYNLLAPFFQQQDISPLLHQALSTLHLALTAVKDAAPASLEGHSQQRIMAARASAAVSYWLLQLSAPLSPVLAAGAAAGAAGGVTGKQLQPAGVFARLDHALLNALSRQAVGDSQAAATQQMGEAPRRTTRQSGTGAAVAATAGAKAVKGASKQAKADAEAAAAAAAAAAAVAAEPELPPEEAAAAAEQLVELTAAQDLVLLHPDGAAWASPSIAARWEC
jgi:hypothetical protein